MLTQYFYDTGSPYSRFVVDDDSEIFMMMFNGSEIERMKKPSYFRQGPGPRFSEKAVIHAKPTTTNYPTHKGIKGESSVQLANTFYGKNVNGSIPFCRMWRAFDGISFSVEVEGPVAVIPIGQFTPDHYAFNVYMYIMSYNTQGKWEYGYHHTQWNGKTGKLDNNGGPFEFLQEVSQTFKRDATLDLVDQFIYPKFQAFGSVFMAEKLKMYAYWNSSSIVSLDRVQAFDYSNISLESAFVCGEPSMFKEVGEFIEYSGGENWPDLSSGGFVKGVLTQSAVYNAFENMPTMSDNNISNAIEAIAFMAGLRDNLYLRHGGALKGSVQDAWLQYRYVYGTTTMDIKEAAEYLDRKANLLTKSKFTIHGISHYNWNGMPMTCRVKMDVENKSLNFLTDAWAWARTYGLQPNLYVAWDVTPFSFIVDWFLPIGDLASAIDAQQFLDKDEYHLSKPVYSLKYTRNDLDWKPSCYTRWVGDMPSFLIGSIFQEKHTSTKTRFKRLADAASLFL